jgi:hypothetical protein
LVDENDTDGRAAHDDAGVVRDNDTSFNGAGTDVQQYRAGVCGCGAFSCGHLQQMIQFFQDLRFGLRVINNLGFEVFSKNTVGVV